MTLVKLTFVFYLWLERVFVFGFVYATNALWEHSKCLGYPQGNKLKKPAALFKSCQSENKTCNTSDRLRQKKTNEISHFYLTRTLACSFSQNNVIAKV